MTGAIGPLCMPKAGGGGGGGSCPDLPPLPEASRLFRPPPRRLSSLRPSPPCFLSERQAWRRLPLVSTCRRPESRLSDHCECLLPLEKEPGPERSVLAQPLDDLECFCKLTRKALPTLPAPPVCLLVRSERPFISSSNARLGNSHCPFTSSSNARRSHPLALLPPTWIMQGVSSLQTHPSGPSTNLSQDRVLPCTLQRSGCAWSQACQPCCCCCSFFPGFAACQRSFFHEFPLHVLPPPWCHWSPPCCFHSFQSSCPLSRQSRFPACCFRLDRLRPFLPPLPRLRFSQPSFPLSCFHEESHPPSSSSFADFHLSWLASFQGMIASLSSLLSLSLQASPSGSGTASALLAAVSPC
mmetsp:Transcript_80727/g.159959  ORF Transcript_80727/g.159959 Transcript_80727/m.159959 type:complete len:354 (-) Transcript_80727:773-1834(-)